MCSSDSEDDCYGNIAQKLQKMKNKYQDDKLESTDLLNDSFKFNNTPKKIRLATKSELKSPHKAIERVEEANTSINSLDNDDITLDSIIANNPRRKTRSSNRNKSDISIDNIIPERTSRRKTAKSRGKKSPANLNPCNSVTNDLGSSVLENSVSSDSPSLATNTTTSVNRARGRRGRGRISDVQSPRRGRGRGRRPRITDFLFPVYDMPIINHAPTHNIPTYSVGNTDEYPDYSDRQSLFTKQPNDVVVVEANDPLDENEELSVKVYWQSSEIFKFTIRRYQKLTQIFDFFAQKENVSHDKLLFTYNDKILNIDNTPDSITYNIVKFIDGGIVNQGITQLSGKIDVENVKNGIKIKFQCQNVKKPFETTIKMDDRLMSAMIKCAEHLEKPLEKLKFQFDGDQLSGQSTPRDLELEGGECIDVKILS